MMYRKHFNAIAAALRSGRASHACIREIAHVLARENINFNPAKFEEKALEGPTQEERSVRFLASKLARFSQKETPKALERVALEQKELSDV